MSKVCQLFSGSSGNSILISSSGVNILVDIGVSAKRCEASLRQRDVEPENIDAIFVTHEHSDHVAGLRVFASRHQTPVFAAPPTLEEMYLTGQVNTKVKTNYMKGVVDVNGIIAQPFALSHDSVYCQGYRFDLPDGRSVSVCTDTGYVTDEAKSIITGSDVVFLESNHEVAMVKAGYYPYPLKQRILSDTGHLSNETSSNFAKDLVESGTSRIILAHLSKENNTPDLARQTTISALEQIGAKADADYRLYVSSPVNESRCIIL